MRALDCRSSFWAGVCVLSLTLKILVADARAEDVSADADSLDQKLLEAVMSDSRHAMARELLEQGGDVNLRDEDGNTLLMLAIRPNYRSVFGRVFPEESLELVDALITAGADLDAKNNQGETALLIASWRLLENRAEVAGRLLEGGASVDLATPNGTTPLMRVVRNDADSTELLLAHGADPNARTDAGATPLLYALHYSRFTQPEFDATTAELLIEAGADPDTLNQRDRYGRNALHSFLPGWSRNRDSTFERNRWLGGVRWLLDRGVEPDVADDFGITPLMRASVLGVDQAVEILLDAGADPLRQTGIDPEGERQTGLAHWFRGFTALHVAAYADQDRVVETLAGLDLDWPTLDSKGNTPLHVAARYASADTVRPLLAFSEWVEMKNDAGATPFSLVPSRAHSDILFPGVFSELIQVFVEAGAKIDFADGDGRTPLHWAAGAGEVDAVRYLLDAGADPNAMDEFGVTPLAWAAGNGYGEVTALLLEAGAKPNEAALRLAEEFGTSETTKILTGKED